MEEGKREKEAPRCLVMHGVSQAHNVAGIRTTSRLIPVLVATVGFVTHTHTHTHTHTTGSLPQGSRRDQEEGGGVGPSL